MSEGEDLAGDVGVLGFDSIEAGRFLQQDDVGTPAVVGFELDGICGESVFGFGIKELTAARGSTDQGRLEGGSSGGLDLDSFVVEAFTSFTDIGLGDAELNGGEPGVELGGIFLDGCIIL